MGGARGRRPASASERGGGDPGAETAERKRSFPFGKLRKTEFGNKRKTELSCPGDPGAEAERSYVFGKRSFRTFSENGVFVCFRETEFWYPGEGGGEVVGACCGVGREQRRRRGPSEPVRVPALAGCELRRAGFFRLPISGARPAARGPAGAGGRAGGWVVGVWRGGEGKRERQRDREREGALFTVDDGRGGNAGGGGRGFSGPAGPPVTERGSRSEVTPRSVSDSLLSDSSLSQ